MAEEYEGFRQWITYNLPGDACAGVECPEPASYSDRYCEGAPEPEEVLDHSSLDPGGCDSASLELLLRDTVYASEGVVHLVTTPIMSSEPTKIGLSLRSGSTSQETAPKESLERSKTFRVWG